MATVMAQMSAPMLRYQERIGNVMEFLKLYEVPEKLGERVLDYVAARWTLTRGIDPSKILSYCPKEMRGDLAVHLNRRVFNDQSCFRLASDGCLRALAVHFQTLHAAPGDYIYHTGESLDALWFIATGWIEVIQDDEIIAILGPDDVIGDEFWRETTIGQSGATVRTLTYSDLHVIKCDKLLEVLGFYTAFAKFFAKNLVITYNPRNKTKFKTIENAIKEKEAESRKEDIVLVPTHPVFRLFEIMRKRQKNKKRKDNILQGVVRFQGLQSPNLTEGDDSQGGFGISASNDLTDSAPVITLFSRATPKNRVSKPEDSDLGPNPTRSSKAKPSRYEARELTNMIQSLKNDARNVYRNATLLESQLLAASLHSTAATKPGQAIARKKKVSRMPTRNSKGRWIRSCRKHSNEYSVQNIPN